MGEHHKRLKSGTKAQNAPADPACVPERLCIRVFTRNLLRSPVGLASLLAAFESIEELRPTHWKCLQKSGGRYDRKQVMDEVLSLSQDFAVPDIIRRKPVRYSAYFSAWNAGLKDVVINFLPPVRQLELVFRLCDALAEGLEAEFGLVHPYWDLGERSQEYSASGLISLGELQRYGPRAVCARTWFGPHLLKLIGSERLGSCGGCVHPTSWGGVRVDLLDPPWNGTFETLHVQQQAVMARLHPTGVFGDYSRFLHFKPGPSWEPIS
jgi:hypothetical protein